MQNLTVTNRNDKDPEDVSFQQFATLLVFFGLVVTIILLFSWARILR